MANKSIAGCSACGYPLTAEYVGQVKNCPMCSSINEAISQEGVRIPTPLLVGVIAFGLGMFLSPAIISSTSEGQKWLERQIRKG